jgi:heat shock protein HslJ
MNAHLPNRLLAAAGLLALAACASAAPHPASIDDLVGAWLLEAAIPAGARLPTLNIAADGTLHGNSGVNRFRGAIDPKALAEGRWRATDLAGERKAGAADAMQLENQFLRALASADRAVVSGDRVLLQRGDEQLAALVRWGRR